VLVSGWFSFEQMGASAGDLFARDVVCDWLREIDREVDVALAPPFEGGVDWQAVDPAVYSHVVFVCGPIGNGPPVDEFLLRFASCRMVGVNLTMLQPLEEWNPFELLLERDSSRTARPDLVFLSEVPRVPVVGLVLIDAQPEYQRDRRESADEVIAAFIASREMAVVRIDTRLDENRTGLRTAAEIESLIARMDLVITTRLHGTVLSIKNGVPVIAIDAVEGGAKITRQVRTLDWPVFIRAEELDIDSLARAFDFCLTPEARATAAACRDRAKATLQPVRADFLKAFEREEA
jgi:hypothetical protein